MLSTRIVSIALGFISGIVIASLWDPGVPGVALLLAFLGGTAWSVHQLHRERNWQPSSWTQLVMAGLLLGLPGGLWRAQQAMHPASASLGSLLENVPDQTALSLRGSIRAEPEPRAENRGNIDLTVSEL